MKKIILNAITLIALVETPSSFSGTGLLFNVSSVDSTLTISTVVPNHTYPAAGIKINTPGYVIASNETPCTPIINGYCLFPVSDTVPKKIILNGPDGLKNISITLCLNGTGELSCQQYQATVSNKIINQHFAYITNRGNNTVSQCSVDSVSGLLSNCATTGNDFNNPVSIKFNSDGSLAYITNDLNTSGTVSKCSVASDTGLLSNCAITGPFFYGPSDIAINPSGSKAYVTSFITSQVYKCDIDPNTDELDNCVTTGSFFAQPTGITLNSQGTFAYVSNVALGSVSLCEIDQMTGLLNSCTEVFQDYQVDPEGVTLNQSGTFLYITNQTDNNVLQCSANPNTGILGICVPTGPLFSGSGAMALNLTGTQAYVPDLNSDSASLCTVDMNTNNLTNCSSSGGTGFDQPSGITIR